MSDRAAWLERWCPELRGCAGLTVPAVALGPARRGGSRGSRHVLARRARVAWTAVPGVQGSYRRAVPDAEWPRGVARSPRAFAGGAVGAGAASCGLGGA